MEQANFSCSVCGPLSAQMEQEAAVPDASMTRSSGSSWSWSGRAA